MPVRRNESVRRNGFALLAVGALATAVAGCGTSTDSTASPSAAPPSSAPAETTQAPPASGGGTDGVNADAAKKLCSDIDAQLSDWRVQGPTLGKPGLNILVQTWAAQNGVINAKVVQDRAIIDRITSENCADTRQQAIEALDIPDLASGLVGL